MPAAPPIGGGCRRALLVFQWTRPVRLLAPEHFAILGSRDSSRGWVMQRCFGVLLGSLGCNRAVDLDIRFESGIFFCEIFTSCFQLTLFFLHGLPNPLIVQVDHGLDIYNRLVSRRAVV